MNNVSATAEMAPLRSSGLKAATVTSSKLTIIPFAAIYGGRPLTAMICASNLRIVRKQFIYGQITVCGERHMTAAMAARAEPPYNFVSAVFCMAQHGEKFLQGAAGRFSWNGFSWNDDLKVPTGGGWPQTWALRKSCALDSSSTPIAAGFKEAIHVPS
jgi:hypothetical protein